MNNKKTSGTVIQIFSFSWLLSLALLTLSLVFDIGIHPVFQYLLGALIVAIAIVFAMGGFHYVEIETDSDLLRVKYFNLFPIGRDYKRLQVQWSRYHGHELRRSFLGMVTFLHLYEQTARGVARYPAFGLSAMKKSEREAIVQFFEKLKR